MTLAEVLADIPGRLARAGIPYMVTGSIASTLHGVPRSTLDLDIVIDPTPETLRKFLHALPSDNYYVDHEAAQEAFRRRDQFNIVEPATGWKVDLIIRKDRPFSREEFGRRRQADISGISTYVATAEDMIIVKLEWARASGSERQLADVAGILAVSGPHLDFAYVDRWVDELGLSGVWAQVRDRTRLDEADPEPHDVTALLDGVDGAWERAQLGLEEDRRGEGIPLEDP